MTTPVLTIRHVIVRLVGGPLYQQETDLWARLLRDLPQVEQHFQLMGLELVLDEEAGYAFLRQESESDEAADSGDTAEPVSEGREAPLPRLMRRQPLAFLPTALLAELRERLLRHDQSTDGTDFLYLEFRDVLEFMRPYCEDTGNEQKIERQVRGAVRRLLELAVLRQVPNRSEVIYRVEPILRAKLPVDEVEAIRNRLKAYLGGEPAAVNESDEADDSDADSESFSDEATE